jgi:hypothetical protein
MRWKSRKETIPFRTNKTFILARELLPIQSSRCFKAGGAME